MNPNDAERIHQHRTQLANLAEAHGFIAKKPHADMGWIWLELYHPDRTLDMEMLAHLCYLQVRTVVRVGSWGV